MSPHWLWTLGKWQVFCHHNHPLPFACAAYHKSGACKFPALTRWRARRGWVAQAVCQTCHCAKVIVICIQRDGSAPKPCSLNKHLGVICVHLDLLFYGLCKYQPLCMSVAFFSRQQFPTVTAHPLCIFGNRTNIYFFFISRNLWFEKLENHHFFFPALFDSFPLICLKHHPWALAVTVCIKPE